MEGKKISFGFMKTKKAEKPVVEEKKEFIECLEGQSIKVVGGEQVEEKAPLVIALKPNTLITAERLKQIAEEVESSGQEPEIKTEKPDPDEIKENETLEQMAVRELLQDSKKPVKVESQMYSVPMPSQPVLDGKKESSLEDYESVPVQEFGLAMLRGMGWAPGKEQSKLKEPQLRPKGLGLGADKVIKKKETKTEKDGKELMLVVNAFVKVINGKHRGYYGKIVSLDEDNGRVVVDLAVKKETVSLSEFMVQPVTKAEFDRESRVINADKFEEFKKQENTQQKSQKHSDSPKPSEAHSSRSEPKHRRDERIDNDGRDKTDRREDKFNGRSRERRRSSEERVGRKERKRHSSRDSLSSSDSDKRKRDKYRKRDSSDSDSSPHRRHKKNKKHKSRSPEKRDIDKKRKGKKKRRDRDRSPNYKKHRK